VTLISPNASCVEGPNVVHLLMVTSLNSCASHWLQATSLGRLRLIDNVV